MNEKTWRILSKWKTFGLYALATLLIGAATGSITGTDAASNVVLALWGIGIIILIIAKLKCASLDGKPSGESQKSERTKTTKAAKTKTKPEVDPSKGPIEWLMACDSRDLFSSEIAVFQGIYDRVIVREALFSHFDEGSPFRKSYELIKKQVLSDIKSSGQFIASYAPSGSAEKTYLYNLMKNSKSLASKLDKLVEEAISNESIADDVDTSFVDDLLESLEDLRQQSH